MYEYLIVDHNHRYSLADLRSLQDWFLRYQIETVPGVAEVASIGGFVRQYQVRLDPDKLRAFNIPLSTVIDKVRDSTNEVGGRLLEFGGAEYMVRGLGYLRSLSDLETVPVASKNGTPVLVRDLGTVSFGPDIRRGVAEWNGEGEAVGGIVVMRYGLNALNVISGVKKKLAEISGSLPPGVEDRLWLRSFRADPSLDRHPRARPDRGSDHCQPRDHRLPFSLPLGPHSDPDPADRRGRIVHPDVLPAGQLEHHVARRVGAGHRGSGGRGDRDGGKRLPALVRSAARSTDDRMRPRSISSRERRRILLDAAKQVGPALFFSLLIIVVSFLPVFLLEAQEGRMFRPLAWTKTLAIGFSSLLAITLVPPLMLLFIRGRLRPESSNPVSRVTQAIYLPVLRLCLRFPKTTVLLNLVFLALTFPLAFKLGSQFMPPLFEGASLYMPTALPGISIGQATQLLQQQDQVLRTFPEVASVFGSIGRSDSATDNAPLDMYDTTVMLKPRGEWRPGMTYEKLISEMDAKLQFPGLTNTWTMPIENRLDMELTGIKTPVGIKIQGPSLDGIEDLGARVQQILGAMPEMRSVFAERVAQGFYINVDVNRAEAARYGLTVGDVQRAITSGIGGENIAENIEGRERYPISVRYAVDFRDDIQKLERVVIATPSNAQVPLGELAKISFSKGPAMIRDEDAALTGYVYLDLNTRDYGGFVSRADKLLREKLQLPAGYSLKWSGEYEFELRAKERLKIMLPVVFVTIFLLLYMVFRSVTEALILIFPTLYAMTGGLLLQWYLGYNFSVAVWVGYIALFGIAVETGVVMVVYLHEALDRRLAAGSALQRADIEQAAIEGAVHRLRPKLMTVAAVLASLVPILWETGVGSDVMKPIAAPIVGGMITSTINVLILVPVFFVMMKARALRQGKLQTPEEADA